MDISSRLKKYHDFIEENFNNLNNIVPEAFIKRETEFLNNKKEEAFEGAKKLWDLYQEQSDITDEIHKSLKNKSKKTYGMDFDYDGVYDTI